MTSPSLFIIIFVLLLEEGYQKIPYDNKTTIPPAFDDTTDLHHQNEFPHSSNDDHYNGNHTIAVDDHHGHNDHHRNQSKVDEDDHPSHHDNAHDDHHAEGHDDHHNIEPVQISKAARHAIAIVWGGLQGVVFCLNLFLIFVIVHPKAKQFHTPTFAVIVSRASSDVLLMIPPLIQASWSTANGHLLLDGKVHLLLGYLYGVGYWALDTNLMLLSANRVVAVCWPFKMKELFTWKRTLTLLIVAWVAPLLINVYTVLRCALLFTADGLFWVYTKNHFECDIGVDCAQAVCIIFIVACYVLAVVRLMRDRRKTASKDSPIIGKRERVLFLQCLGICTFHVLTTLIWVFILHLGFRNLFFTIAHPISQAFDSMIDVLTYVGFNSKLREQAKVNVGLKSRVAPTTSVTGHGQSSKRMQHSLKTLTTNTQETNASEKAEPNPNQ